MRFWNGPQLLVIDLGRLRDYAETPRAASTKYPLVAIS
jgi:hypothetical protein